MSSIRPVMFSWAKLDVCDADSGEVRATHAMVPIHRFSALSLRQFALGEQYALGPVENIGAASRGGFFASIRETWNSLPEEDERFPSPEHFRKRALVAAGWATHTQTIMETPKDARAFATGLRRVEEYAVITVKGCVVDVWVAKSIAAGQIHQDDWRVVKPKALDWAAAQVKVSRSELEEHAMDGGAR